jgi:NAD(P)H-dependent FMN reductase
LVLAEVTLRTEIPRPTLTDLLELTALIALKAPHRHARVAARWLQRWLEAFGDATIDDVVLAASALQALGGRHHSPALSALRALAEEATSRGRPR